MVTAEFAEKSETIYDGKEIAELAEIIERTGSEMQTTFYELFEAYNEISNKLVGTLLRARKHGVVAFDGEVLLQGRDDSKVIKLLMPSERVREMVGAGARSGRWGSSLEP